jgi:hypothetical protein
MEQTLLADASGLHAKGIQVAAEPVAYSCRYELYTDEAWASVHFEAAVEGPGFLRSLRMERAAGRWRVTASEQGDLSSVLPDIGLPGLEEPDALAHDVDVDLAGSPLTNTLPVRRLGLLEAKIGTAHTVGVAWVDLPSLAIVHSVQTYTVAGPGAVFFRAGDFEEEITLDPQGYVTHYPGLATRT